MVQKRHPFNYHIVFLVIALLVGQAAEVLLFISYSSWDSLSLLLFIVIQFLFAVCFVLVFILNKKIAGLNEQIRNSQSLDEQKKFELQYYELIKSHRQEIATMRHEIANGLQVAALLLKSQSSEDNKKGAALLYDIGQQNSVQNDTIYCDNSIINTIIAVKAKIAKGLSIRTKFDIAAVDDIAISKLDLCSVFGNLLDNAIEAAKRAKEKYIELKAAELSGFFVIKVKNSKANVIKKVKEEIITSKADRENRHGKGLKMLRRIAEKYDGKLSIDYNEESFTAVVTLKIK